MRWRQRQAAPPSVAPPSGILAPMSDTSAAVSGFLKEFWGEIEALSDDADIFHNLGIDGDDAFEFIERFAAKFEIEITNYHWYSTTERSHSSTSAACSLGHRTGEWVVFRSHLTFSLKLFVQSDGPWNTQRIDFRVCVGIFGSVR